MLKGFVFICNNDLVIEEFFYNSLGSEINIQEGNSFYQICDYEEKTKVKEFINTLKLEGACFSWEINVRYTKHLKPLKFSGSKFDDKYFIFALETNNDVPFLYEELMRINNEQANYIRQILKDRFLENIEIIKDDNTYDELSKLNNELANLQRELAKKNIELSRLNEIKNQFLGMAAHDLRNPLGNVYNFAELLEDDENQNLNEEQLMFVSVIKKQSMFMLNMVNDLLDFSAIESGEINLNFSNTNLKQIVSETISLTESLASRKSIKLIFNKSSAMIDTYLDRDKIEQVLTNLLTNAIKFSEENSEVTINLTESSTEFLVEVKDNGLGIRAEELGKLFKAFNITSTTGTSGEKSTGLGLYICKKIIEAHKGRIWAESVYGEGSSFFFSLPKVI